MMPHHWRPLVHERNSIFKCIILLLSVENVIKSKVTKKPNVSVSRWGGETEDHWPDGDEPGGLETHHLSHHTVQSRLRGVCTQTHEDGAPARTGGRPALSERVIDWWSDCVIDWLIDWLNDWLSEWVSGWVWVGGWVGK